MNEHLRMALYVIAFVLFVLLVRWVNTEEAKHPSRYLEEHNVNPAVMDN